jgi:fatty-acyl-CoA synthase
MVMGNLCAMMKGAGMVYPSFGFHPFMTLQAMSEENCTTMYGVPTMFNDVIRE